MSGLQRWVIYRRLRKWLSLPWLHLQSVLADRGIFLTKNVKKLSCLHDIHRDKRCFIIGNGPSLTISDLNQLSNEITLAANKIYLAFDQTHWRPDYYFVVDRMVAENSRKIIAELPLKKYVTRFLRPLFPGDDFGHFEIRGGCRTDIRHGLDSGATVISSMIQFAYFMGFREIYLIGVDFDFISPPITDKKTPEGDRILIANGEQNHFHPNYRSPGERWTYPKLDEQHAYFVRARDFYREREGRDILFNASRNTKLDALPTVDFDRLFSS